MNRERNGWTEHLQAHVAGLDRGSGTGRPFKPVGIYTMLVTERIASGEMATTLGEYRSPSPHVLSEHHFGWGDVEAAAASADLVVEGTYTFPMVTLFAIEPTPSWQ